MLEDEPLVVENAQSDERFATNPVVTKPGGIRFYVGIPLRNSQGLVLGSLCAMDTRPRQLTPQEQAAMQDLADIVIGEIHLRERLIEEQKSVPLPNKRSMRCIEALKCKSNGEPANSI